MSNPTQPIHVLAFSGSLRKGSFTTMLLKAFQKLAPERVTVTIADISQLPFINQDLESDLPAPVKELHDMVNKAEAVILATPEYNRSYSPVLKNALDWGSRPQGQSKWAHKPVLILGCSPYQLGASCAVNHLRQVVMYLDMPPLQQPEFYLSKAADRFDSDGNLTDDETKQLIAKTWTAFTAWIEKLAM